MMHIVHPRILDIERKRNSVVLAITLLASALSTAQVGASFAGPMLDVVCAAEDTPAELKAGATYVCPADDARPMLQQALDRSARLQVKCRLLPGTYVVNSRGEHSPKGGLCFPNLEGDDPDLPKSIFVTLEGPVSPHGDGGAVIKMGRRLYDDIGKDEVFSLFYCDGGRVILRAWAIRNLFVRLPENQKPIVVFDGRFCGALAYENVTAHAFDQPWKVNHRTGEGVPPAHPGCVAFRGTCGSNSGANTTWKVLKAYGFGVGFDIGGEHVYCESLAAYYNTWGFRFNCYRGRDWIKDGENAPRHGVEVYPNYCVNLLDEHSTNLPVFGNEGSCTTWEGHAPAITIRSMNIQWPNVCLGYTNRHALTFLDGRSRARETVPGFWRGSIEYVMDHTTEGCGVNFVHAPFFEKGEGLNVTCRNLTDELKGTSETRRRYLPNPMQQYYDTDLGKMLFFDGVVWRDFMGNAVNDAEVGPSCEFTPVAGAVRYRFAIRDSEGQVVRFFAKSPTEPLTPVWGSLPKGNLEVECRACAADGRDLGRAGICRLRK